MSEPDALLTEASRIIAERIGHVVPNLYAERVAEGVRRAQATLRAHTPEHALAQLGGLPVECPAWQGLIQAITIGETNFLRHREWFLEVTTRVLEPLIAQRRRHGPKRIDLWSAGCSTGEEAYTLAMIVNRLLADEDDFTVRIVATDINAAALQHARAATYRRWSMRELDPIVVARDFSQARHSHYRLSSRLSEMVDFSLLNLCSDAYPDAVRGFSHFDLIICRNVLIYFGSKDQLAIASRLARSLAPGGWLAVSPAEATAEWYKPLRMVNGAAAILFHNSAAGEPKRKSAPPKMTARAHATASAGLKTSFGTSQQCLKTDAKLRTPASSPAPSTTTPPTSAAAARSSSPAAPASQPRGRDLVNHARGLADRGAYAEARQACERHLADSGPDFGAYLLLATVSLESGELNGAFDAARCAAYLEPDSAAAHYMLGTIHHRMGSLQLASRKMAVVMQLLQLLPEEERVSEHFNATVGELRASAGAYLSDHLEA